MSDRLGSCVTIATSSSSKGFSQLFTPPYPKALFGLSTPSFLSQSLPEKAGLGSLFSSTVTLIQPLCVRQAFPTISQAAQRCTNTLPTPQIPGSKPSPLKELVLPQPKGLGPSLYSDSFQIINVEGSPSFN